MKRTLPLMMALALVACQPKTELIPAENFEADIDGRPVRLYTLKDGDITLQVTNYGARVVSILTPDRKGHLTDIVAGHNTLQEYIYPPAERFLGACVGPVANRIGGASFEVDGVTYHTPVNDNGANTLHGGLIGLDHVVWEVTYATDKALAFKYVHKDGQEGFPGNLEIVMTYNVTPDNGFRIDYSASTDAATPVNITNHPFFCLRGEGTGTVEDYEMWIKASRYLPIDAQSIPTGEIASVEGTPFDFRGVHTIGERIGEDNEQLRNAHGYDHNWCLDKEKEGVELVCRVHDPVSGRTVEVLTDQPGLQFYSGNFFAGAEKGKNGKVYGFRSSLALETQGWPDAVNHDNFPSVLLRPGEYYSHSCIYRFSAE